MALILEEKDGKEKFVFVSDSVVGVGAPPPVEDPNKLRDQLVNQCIKTELQDIISTCQEIGSTDGKGGGQSAGGSGPDLTNGDDPAVTAAKAAEAAAQAKENAAEKAAQAAEAAAKAADGKVPAAQAAAKAAEAAYQNALEHLAAIQKEVAALQAALYSDESELKKLLQNPLGNLSKIASLEKKIDAESAQISQDNTQIQQFTNSLPGLKKAAEAAEQAVKPVQDAANAADAAAKHADQNLTNAQNALQVAKANLQKAESSAAGKMHDLIWNHNVFWALLQVAMAGNSSIFNILTQALGQISDLLEGNQYVTGIITEINSDLQQLVSLQKNLNGGKPTPAQAKQEEAVIADLQKQLQLLQDVMNPPTGNSEEAQKAREANKSLGPNSDLMKQLKALVADYTQEGSNDNNTGTGPANDDSNAFAKMLANMKKGDFSGFNKFWSNMVNASKNGGPSGSPGSGPTSIYTQTSAYMTGLNTAGSEFMAKQNLDTKQIDMVEKLWTSGFQTDKSTLQSVLGNIAN